MKKFTQLCMFVLAALIIPSMANSTPPEREYYEIRIYSVKNTDQEQRIDQYLKDALLPALHRNGISQVGVFKPIANDTSAIRKVYLLIPYRTLEQSELIKGKLEKDKQYLSAGADYIDAPYTNPPYQRIEKIFAKAFSGMPAMQPVKLTSPRSERVYEMRSYESATEKLHTKKVQMFNDGNEVGIFKRLGFNAVFYSQAITGTALPNLIYMITFASMDAHDKLWENFKNDAEWKKLSALQEYQNVMNKADAFLMRPTDYSDY